MKNKKTKTNTTFFSRMKNTRLFLGVAVFMTVITLIGLFSQMGIESSFFKLEFADHFLHHAASDIGPKKVPNKGHSHILVLKLNFPGQPSEEFAMCDWNDNGAIDAREKFCLEIYDKKKWSNAFANDRSSQEQTFQNYWLRESLGKYNPTTDYIEVNIKKNIQEYCNDGLSEEVIENNCKSIDSTINIKDELLIQDAINIAIEEKGIQLSDYDINGATSGKPDGYLDGLILIPNFAFRADASTVGTYKEETDAEENTRQLKVPLKIQGIKISIRGYTGIADNISTPLHEFGHLLGFSDLYVKNEMETSGGLGLFSLMAVGPYQTILDPWSKYKIGWANIETVSNTEVVNIPPVEETGIIYKLGGEREYFLIENRQMKGWNESKQKYEMKRGLAIFHINELLNPGSYGWTPQIMLEQSHGLFCFHDLTIKNSYCDDLNHLFVNGDTFLPGKEHATEDNKILTSNWYNGEASGVRVEEIDTMQDTPNIQAKLTFTGNPKRIPAPIILDRDSFNYIPLFTENGISQYILKIKINRYTFDPSNPKKNKIFINDKEVTIIPSKQEEDSYYQEVSFQIPEGVTYGPATLTLTNGISKTSFETEIIHPMNIDSASIVENGDMIDFNLNGDFLGNSDIKKLIKKEKFNKEYIKVVIKETYKNDQSQDRSFYFYDGWSNTITENEIKIPKAWENYDIPVSVVVSLINSGSHVLMSNTFSLEIVSPPIVSNSPFIPLIFKNNVLQSQRLNIKTGTFDLSDLEKNKIFINDKEATIIPSKQEKDSYYQEASFQIPEGITYGPATVTLTNGISKTSFETEIIHSMNINSASIFQNGEFGGLTLHGEFLELDMKRLIEQEKLETNYDICIDIKKINKDGSIDTYSFSNNVVSETEIRKEKAWYVNYIPIKTEINIAHCASNILMSNTFSFDITPKCTESNWTSESIPTECPSDGKQTETWSKIGTCEGGVERTNKVIQCIPKCTNDNWTSEPIPAECPADGKQTETWTKVGICEGGVERKNKVIQCIPKCTDANWTSETIPLECPSDGNQTETWTKVGTCEGGVERTNKVIQCIPKCTESNWISEPVPAECPSNGNQTETWTKVGSCEGGEERTNKIIQCIPKCTESNWTSETLPLECPSDGKQTETWTKVGTCEGGIERTNKVIQCIPPTLPGDFSGIDGGTISQDDLMEAAEEDDEKTINDAKPDGEITFDDVIKLYKHYTNSLQYPLPSSGDFVGIGGGTISKDDVLEAEEEGDTTMINDTKPDGEITFDDVIKLYKHYKNPKQYPLTSF